MGEDDKDAQGVTIAIPGSATDFAKGLRELIAALRDVTGLVFDATSAVTGVYRKRRSRRAASSLDSLSFPPQGFRRNLERIAAGTGRSLDIEAIDAQLGDTFTEVKSSMDQLSLYRGALREERGMKVVEILDTIIYGEFGKYKLRDMLTELVQSTKDLDPKSEGAISQTKAILAGIEKLNHDIAALHDAVLGKNGS